MAHMASIFEKKVNIFSQNFTILWTFLNQWESRDFFKQIPGENLSHLGENLSHLAGVKIDYLVYS